MARSFSERWNTIRSEFTLQDLALDVTGKMLVGIGIGALLAAHIAPIAWAVIGVGLGCSAIVKAKHWKRFWS